MIANCLHGWHLRGWSSGVCRECGDITDPAAEHDELLINEPPAGAVMMASGPAGTAWQRLNDGYWHSTTGKRAPWLTLMKSDRPGSRTRLVYLPPR